MTAVSYLNQIVAAVWFLSQMVLGSSFVGSCHGPTCSEPLLPRAVDKENPWKQYH